MDITLDQLKKALPALNPVTAVVILPVLNLAFKAYKIDTPRRQAIFLAQAAHESASFKSLEENLNYTAHRLMQVWPKRFNEALAIKYAGKPKELANFVYANRYGNGDEASGDGWTFRGSGAFQTTFKDNHARAAKVFGKTLEEVSPWLRTPSGAVWGAALYWHDNALNAIADKPDTWRGTRNKIPGLDPIDYISVAINGGRHGLAERRSKYSVAAKALGVK